MKEFNTPLSTIAKRLLAWTLSLQLAGVSLLSNVAYAGKEGTINKTVKGTVTGTEAEKLQQGYVPQTPVMIDHGAPPPPPPAKKKFCKHEDGRWKAGCIIAGILIGVAVIIALVNASKRRGRPPSGGGVVKPRPTEKPKPEPEPAPEPEPEPTPEPPVPCCQNPAPAPAPAGEGVVETSTVTTGNAPIEGVDPVIVENP